MLWKARVDATACLCPCPSSLEVFNSRSQFQPNSAGDGWVKNKVVGVLEKISHWVDNRDPGSAAAAAGARCQL